MYMKCLVFSDVVRQGRACTFVQIFDLKYNSMLAVSYQIFVRKSQRVLAEQCLQFITTMNKRRAKILKILLRYLQFLKSCLDLCNNNVHSPKF